MTFTHQQMSVSFRHGPRPSGGSRSYDCKIFKTPTGLIFSDAPRATPTIWTIQWGNMPEADKTNLEAFFGVVRGMSDPFYWTLPDGTVKTVHFAAPVLGYREKSYGVFDVSLELLES